MGGKAIGYIRVSRIDGREGGSFLSPTLQRASIERICDREGLELIDVVEELDASGGDSSRPLWNRCIERIEKGEANALCVWNLDRFSRSIVDGFRAIQRIEDAGGRLISEDGASSKLDRGLRLLMGEVYRDQARDGFRRAVSSAIERGVYIARRVPFGYVRDSETRRLVPNPETAPVLIQLFERRAKGESWVKLAAWLRENGGSPTTSRTSVREMVHNVAYLGWARQGEIINRKAHEPLVSQRLFDRASKMGTAPRHDGSISSQTLLSPICAGCGHRMQANRSQGRRLPNGKREKIISYSCLNHRCEARAWVKAGDLDTWVVGNLFLLLDKVGTVGYEVPGTDPVESAEARRRVEEAEYARSKFLGNKEQRLYLTDDEYNDILRELTDDVQEARIVLESVETEELPKVENIKALWREWTIETQREWLRSMVELVTVTSVKGRRGVHIVERAHIVYASGWEIGAGSAGKAWDLPSDDDVRRASWALGLVPMY